MDNKHLPGDTLLKNDAAMIYRVTTFGKLDVSFRTMQLLLNSSATVF